MRVAKPAQSGRAALGVLDSSTRHMVMASAATPMGRFTKKMPRQLMPVVITPPSTGPSATATPVTAPQIPNAMPAFVAMETLGQQSQRGGEEDRPADALGATGQDQHDRRLGHAAEQRTEGEDDEADGEEQAPTVTVGQRPGRQQHRGQSEGIGIDDPLHVAEAGVQSRLDGRQGHDDDGDVQQQHEGRRTDHDQGPPLLFHDRQPAGRPMLRHQFRDYLPVYAMY